MTLPVKIGVSTLTVGAITGAGYAGGAYLMKKETADTVQQRTAISALVDKEYTHILLKTDAGDGNTDQAHWRTIWDIYASQSGTNANPLKLEGWTTRESNNLIDKLKEKCALLADTNAIDNTDKNYLNVTKYCSRSVTIADEIEKLKLKTRILKTQEGNSEDKSVWDKRVSEKEKLKNHFANLNISFDDADVTKVKTGCNGATLKPKTEGKYSEILKAYKAVCIKQIDEQ